MQESFFRPIEDAGGTAGYANISAVSDGRKVGKTADKYLKDSELLSKLTRRVF